MPIYHLNIYDGAAIPDLDGHDLPDLEAAKREAIILSGNLIRELGPSFWEGHEWRMEVTDANNLILFSLVFMGSMSPAGLRTSTWR